MSCVCMLACSKARARCLKKMRALDRLHARGEFATHVSAPQTPEACSTKLGAREELGQRRGWAGLAVHRHGLSARHAEVRDLQPIVLCHQLPRGGEDSDHARAARVPTRPSSSPSPSPLPPPPWRHPARALLAARRALTTLRLLRSRWMSGGCHACRYSTPCAVSSACTDEGGAEHAPPPAEYDPTARVSSSRAPQEDYPFHPLGPAQCDTRARQEGTIVACWSALARQPFWNRSYRLLSAQRIAE